MATKEKIQEFISASKSKVEDALKSAGDNKYDLALREQKKKVKRLTRKLARIEFDEKRAAIRKTKKKDRSKED